MWPSYWTAGYWSPRYWPRSGEVPVPIVLPDIDLQLVGSLSQAVVAGHGTTADVQTEIIAVSPSASMVTLAPSQDGVEMVIPTTVTVEPTLTTVDLEASWITVEIDE